MQQQLLFLGYAELILSLSDIASCELVSVCGDQEAGLQVCSCSALETLWNKLFALIHDITGISDIEVVSREWRWKM